MLIIQKYKIKLLTEFYRRLFGYFNTVIRTMTQPNNLINYWQIASELIIPTSFAVGLFMHYRLPNFPLFETVLVGFSFSYAFDSLAKQIIAK